MLYANITTAALCAIATASNVPAPYQISVDPKLIAEAATKAKLYRPSIGLEDRTSDTWREGPPVENMTALARYWADEYDWLERSTQRPNAIPLLMLHGWPSTHTEWSAVLKPLTSPKDSSSPAFHVVTPDLPGFGFSPAPTRAGFGPRQAAAAFADLMKTLGYEKYGVVSTDLGWWVGMFMAGDHAEHLVGHFTDFFSVSPTPADLERYSSNQTDAAENEYIGGLSAFSAGFGAYMTMQSQGPLKLSQALNDSPVGYAGWIWPMIHAISDGYPYTLKQIVTRTLLLWVGDVYGNVRAYLEWLKPEASNFPESDVPTGVAQWGATGPFNEIAGSVHTPRSWIERQSNVTFFIARDFGGHFAVEHYPDLYAQDLREFFGQLTA
ncbi:epoxide hydrolase [Microdochium trichocladiopsis]|uniref:Epoxide hydrolase n=1 Tax=Microdochium trichocladiopsis TaxID=1682393 RepID=A0A9P9BU14_9PEZI|nr:epoxide hydrolase [Microdochium trichocladiopsis]KAH7036017.1 epoxide hydrolase [Microdochium trichocladiopsis]